MPTRRRFLRRAAAAVLVPTVAVPLSACAGGDDRAPRQTSTEGSPPAPVTGARILLAYFSRAGENYWYGGRTTLEVGNTEVLAQLIRDRVDCDVHRIVAADPYSDDYEQTVERNVREQEGNARPAIAEPLASIEQYGTVLLASPIWNVRAPMIMATFAETYDFTGKVVLPVTTYAVSGLGRAPDDYARVCRGAQLGTGLAVRGEEVRAAGPAVDAWLRRTRLLAR